MHPTNLSGVDLNLLRVLDALLTERHVTRAAEKVGLSQPAMSHALARLRELLGDPLLVRASKGLVLTAKGEAMAVPLRRAMMGLEVAWTGSASFDPATARRSFSLATADYGGFVVVPPLLARVREEAPGVDVWVKSVGEDPYAQLASGEVDLLCNVMPRGEAPAGIHSRLLFEERFVCVVRRGHPALRKGLTLDTFCSLSHVFVAPRGTPGGVVDTALAELGRARRVAVGVSHFLVAPHLVAESDMVVTIGARMAAAYVKLLPLRVVEPPLALPGFRNNLVWHDRAHHDPAQVWLRSQIVGLFHKQSQRR